MVVCLKCKFYNICKGRLNETVENCARFKSVEQINETNEEYMQTCSSDELANTIFRLIVHGTVIRPDREYIKKWLKEKHNDL